MHSCLRSAVRLAQSTTPAQRPDQPPELEITHLEEVEQVGLPPAYRAMLAG